MEGLHDLKQRLKEAFLVLVGPEESEVRKEKEEHDASTKKLERQMDELHGFVRQVQQAFSLASQVTPSNGYTPGPLPS